MYNKYMPHDSEMFSELYRDVGRECEKRCGDEKEGCDLLKGKPRERFDLKRLLHGLDVEKLGMVPLVLLLLLLLDVDDEERIIIIALVVIFGI